MAGSTMLERRLRLTLDQIGLIVWRLRMRRIEFNAAQHLLSNVGWGNEREAPLAVE